MAIPDPVQPDDIFKAIVGTVFGDDSLVLYIVVVVMALQAWFAWAKSMHDRARLLYTRASQIPAAVRLMSALGVLVAVIAQTIYLVLSYFIAAHLPRAVSSTSSPSQVDVRDWLIPPASPIHEPAFQWCFAIASMLVLFSWWAILRDHDRRKRDAVALVLAIVGGMASLAFFVNEGGNKQMGLVALVYFAVAVLALYAPGISLKRAATE